MLNLFVLNKYSSNRKKMQKIQDKCDKNEKILN